MNRPLKLEEIPPPTVGEEDVLVRIKAAGICGSDISILKRGFSKPPKLPIILGHEMSGIIERVGTKVRDVSIGERVAVDYVISCGQCFYCNQGAESLCTSAKGLGSSIDGGYAEYVAVPARNVLKLPESIPFDQAAIMGCAVATAFHAVGVAQMRPGDTVAIYGLGGVGIHVVKWAKALGAGKIVGIDADPGKLKVAKEFGCETALNPLDGDTVPKIMEVTHGFGADVAIECVGNKDALEQAIACLGKQGRMVFVGNYYGKISIDPCDFNNNEKHAIGSCDHTRNDLRRIIQLVVSGRIDLSTSITHRVRFEELVQGLEILDARTESPLRVVAVL